MIKSFLKDALIYTIPTILSRGIAIFILPIYTRITSPAELGALDLFLMFGNIVALTVAFEVSQGVARYIPEITDHPLRRAYSSTGLYFTILMYSTFMVSAFYYSLELNLFITGNIEYADFFNLALFYIFLHGIFYYLQNQLRFENKSIGYAVVSVTYAVLNLVSVYVLGFVFDLGLYAIFYSIIFSVLVSAALAFVILKNSFALVFRPDLLKKLLSFSVPLVPASVLVFVSLYVDRYMIKLFLGLDSVGVYGVAIRLASAASLVMLGFQMAITPLIYKYHDRPDTPKNLAIIFKYFIVFSLLFFLAYSFVVQELLFILTTSEYYAVGNLIPLLVLSFLFSNMYVFMPGISIKKKTYLIFIINLVVAILNLVLNYFLIPYMGIIGAALATALGYFVAFLFYAFFSQKLYFVNHRWVVYSVPFIVSILMVNVYFTYIVDLDYLFTMALRFLLIVFFLFVIFSTRMISCDELIVIKNAAYKKLIK